MQNELLEKIRNDLSINSMILPEIIKQNKEDFNKKTIIDSVNFLYVNNFIIKERKDSNISFYINLDKKDDKIINEKTAIEDSADYHAVSKLARKFRSSRYHVERDIVSSALLFSLKIEKNDECFFIKYVSSIDFFKKNNIFNDILNIDNSIRIVTSDEYIKLSICKLFDKYICEKYGKDGYIGFRKNHSFNILTLEQFFKKTTWKNSILQFLSKLHCFLYFSMNFV